MTLNLLLQLDLVISVIEMTGKQACFVIEWSFMCNKTETVGSQVSSVKGLAW